MTEQKRILVGMISGVLRLPRDSGIMYGDEYPQYSSGGLRGPFLNGEISIDEATDIFRSALVEHLKTWTAEKRLDELRTHPPCPHPS